MAYDPRLVDVIYLVGGPGDPQLIPCILGPRSQKYGGHCLSFEDVHAMMHDQNSRHSESSDYDQQRQIDFKGEINNILEEQKDRNNAAKGTTRTFGTTATKEARAAAAKECAQEDARVLGQAEETNGKIIRLFDGNHAPAAKPEPSAPSEITPKDARDNLLDKFFKTNEHHRHPHSQEGGVCRKRPRRIRQQPLHRCAPTDN